MKWSLRESRVDSTGKFTDECLNENWFVSLCDAQRTIEAWRIDDNVARPHRSLADRTPDEFAKAQLITATSTNPQPD
ncbi:MAG: transposase [Gemmatimonadaceae bacterium]|nr:transposase [Gemmatimonadaceae bacterium]